MPIYNDIKRAVSATVDAIVDKTSTQAQKSRLVTVMRNEENVANQAYIELGKYLYDNLRESVPEDIAAVCEKIDFSRERMSRAQQRYREVIQQENVNREINKTEAKENFEKFKTPIVAKAKDTAEKVKETAVDTAGKVKESAKETAEKVKESAKDTAEKASEFSHKITKPVEEKIEEKKEELEVLAEELEGSAVENDTLEDIFSEPEATENSVETSNKSDAEVIENAIFTESTEEESAEEPAQETLPEPVIAPEESAEAAVEENNPVSETQPIDQEFQRIMAVDIISENEFEENEPEVKPLEKNSPISKAMKLRKIITKKNNEE